MWGVQDSRAAPLRITSPRDTTPTLYPAGGPQYVSPVPERGGRYGWLGEVCRSRDWGLGSPVDMAVHRNVSDIGAAFLPLPALQTLTDSKPRSRMRISRLPTLRHYELMRSIGFTSISTLYRSSMVVPNAVQPDLVTVQPEVETSH